MEDFFRADMIFAYMPSTVSCGSLRVVKLKRLPPETSEFVVMVLMAKLPIVVIV